MATVETEIVEAQQFIGGEWVAARAAARRSTTSTRSPATSSRASRPARARTRRSAIEAAAAAFPGVVAATPPAVRQQDLPQGRRHPREPAGRGRLAARARDRRQLRLRHVPDALRARALPPGGRRRAYAPMGEIIPSDTRRVRDGHPPAGRRRRRDRAVERGADPLGALDRRAARARQHGRAEAVRALAVRRRAALGRDLRRGGPAAGRPEHRHARARRGRRRSATSSSRTRTCAGINFTGSTRDRPQARRGGGAQPQARRARARRLQPADRARATPISSTRSTRPRSAPSCTRARSACRRGGSSSSARSPTSSSSGSPRRRPALKAGDPKEHDTIIGPLITEQALELVKSRVDDAVAKGAKVLAGGEAVGPCYQATLLTDVPEDSEFAQHETFGPVACDRGRRQRRRGGRARERDRVRPRVGHHHERRRPRPRARAADRGRDRPRQRPAGRRRAADAVRRRQGQRLGTLRRPAPRSTSSPSCAGSRSERHAPVPVLRRGAMAEIVPLAEAVAELVHDGDTVALEGFTHLIPHAAGHELIRQGRRDLTLSG